MTEIGLLLAAVFLGSVVSGFTGFAFSAAAGAILLHVFDPLLALALLMGCSIVSQGWALALLGETIEVRPVTALITGGVFGVALGIFLLTRLDPGMVRTVFGTLLTTYAAYLLWRRISGGETARLGTVRPPTIGFLGGLVGGLTAMPGAVPVIWCELRATPKARQRALVQPFILSMQVIALILLLASAPRLDPRLGFYMLAALPALAAGTWLGMAFFRRVDDALFRKAVLLMLLVSGAAMIDWPR